MHDLKAWPEADDLLDEALALPAGERLAFLRRRASHDPALLAALVAVLDEADGDDGFLDPGGAVTAVFGRDEDSAVEPQRSTALRPGDRLQQYDIVELIGRGGMGEVYLARDTRLERDVAIKVLPERFAASPNRRARFAREARVLASLSHPGIAAIYGIAETDRVEALVLEYVPGPTLAERLDGHALSVSEALDIGRRLVEALAAAHDRGILHRDLKPANIKITPDGHVKILDFGLAKTLGPSAPPGVDISAQMPGVLFGTAAYMSPERARGIDVDHRADIWAFGCVLYEMLTGTRAFDGQSTTEVLARVMDGEPAFDRIPSGTPPAIRRLLRRTLEKDPRRRLGYIGDALLEFDDAATRASDRPAVRRPRAMLAATLAAGLLLGSAGAWLARRAPATAASPLSRLVMTLPPGDVPVSSFQPAAAVSPDGRTIVYRARHGNDTALFRRDLADLDARPITGTERGTGPFFSPDGRWLGFDGDGVLKRVSLDGGTPTPIAPAPGGVTATWLHDDTIVFATNTGRVLQRVAASGGPVTALTTLDQRAGDTLHLLPDALPGGDAILFTVIRGFRRHVAVLRLASREIHLVADGTHARFLAPDTLVFGRDGALWAAGFDPRRMSLTGPAIPLSEQVENTDGTVLHFATSPGGAMVYLPAGASDGPLQKLVWFDRHGRETPIALPPRPYARVALSPDGRRFAVAIREAGNTDVWVADPERRATTRLTLDPTIETAPVWSPDGRTIAFRSEREGPGLFRRDADGAGVTERLTETAGPIHSPYSWTPDGTTLLFAIFRSFRSQAIASVTPPSRAVHVLLDGDFAQLDPQVSPDGRWMAYQSDESGQFEVYVRPYPDVASARWRVSTDGGTSPRWRRDGRELFYFDGAGLMSVPVAGGPAFHPGPPGRLFDVRPFGGRLGADYEVAPDGRRFVFIVDGPPAPPRQPFFVVVQNWADAVRARLRDAR